MSRKQKPEAPESTPEAKTTAPAAKAAKREPAAVSSGASEGKGGLFTWVKEFKEYLVLSRIELRKVSWPNWKETRATSIVVLGFVAVMAILLGLVDLILSSAVRFILS